MSLIIAYVGKKGCVMASDKRKIGYFGDKKNLATLEEELYSGSIDNDEDFLTRANELGISIKITDDARAVTCISIFMASITAMSWPACTAAPSLAFQAWSVAVAGTGI